MINLHIVKRCYGTQCESIMTPFHASLNKGLVVAIPFVANLFHLKHLGIWFVEYSIEPLLPFRLHGIAKPGRCILPVVRILPRELPVNDCNDLSLMNNYVKGIEVTMSETWRTPRPVLFTHHILDVVVFLILVPMTDLFGLQASSDSGMKVLCCLKRAESWCSVGYTRVVQRAPNTAFDAHTRRGL